MAEPEKKRPSPLSAAFQLRGFPPSATLVPCPVLRADVPLPSSAAEARCYGCGREVAAPKLAVEANLMLACNPCIQGALADAKLLQVPQ